MTQAPIITNEDMRKILARIDTDLDTLPDGARREMRANTAMATLVAINTGMTVGEVCGLSLCECGRDATGNHGIISSSSIMRDGATRPAVHVLDARERDVVTGADLIDRIGAFDYARRISCPPWVGGSVEPLIASTWRTTWLTPPRTYWTRPPSIAKGFRAMCGRAGVGEPYTFASLRRTHAAMLLGAGAPANVVAARLGIADPATMAGTYGAECAGGEARRSEWAARVEDVRRDAWGSTDPEGRAAAAIIHDALAALAG